MEVRMCRLSRIQRRFLATYPMDGLKAKCCFYLCRMRHFNLLLLSAVFLSTVRSYSQAYRHTGSNHGSKFEQLDYLIPSPNEYRTASGAPGPRYWQQRADYDISATLNEEKQQLFGKETITYHNNSPSPLSYIWLQLDENEHDPNSDNHRFDESSMRPQMSDGDLNRFEYQKNLAPYGDKILSVTDASGKPLPYTINQTMMRVDMPRDLMPGSKFVFKVEWMYNIIDRMKYGGRGGYEFFPEDGNHIFTMSQWYPRLCVYSDFQGWQNRQFTGRGEFALAFGNFSVKMTVPADHLVCATGEGQNYASILSPASLKRWQQAQTSKEPVEIVTLEEAKKAEENRGGSKNKATKTWHFKAENVRDFAWGSSRKFVWDAMAIQQAGKKVMCMSFYGKEAYPLYRRYSTKVVAHTIRTYSKYTIDYPYPVAQSIEASSGMEYPMICFNYGRAEKDGTYSEAIKYGMIGVIIHEVGHNFFPMIVNSDERQWSWMDEGLNTFVQYLTEQEFDNNYPSSRGPAHKIADYMRLSKDQLEPIMTNSDNIVQFGPNAYSKPATALNILRETVMGRELFDFAFKTYSKRWAFRHPTPADFFRTMEDASAVDLDWFWRGWFFGIDPVDISIDSVKWYKLDAGSADLAYKQQSFKHLGQIRNAEDKSIRFAVDADTSLRDFYYFNRSGDDDEGMFRKMMQATPPPAPVDKALDSLKAKWAGKNFYELSFSNLGGLVMPLIVEFTFKDGSKEVDRIAAHIWRKNESKVKKVFMKDKEVVSIKLDPYRETADINENNGVWPLKEMPTRFQLFKGGRFGRGAMNMGKNPMQKAREKEAKQEK